MIGFALAFEVPEWFIGGLMMFTSFFAAAPNLYRNSWKFLISSVLGSKLPIFPYNRDTHYKDSLLKVG